MDKYIKVGHKKSEINNVLQHTIFTTLSTKDVNVVYMKRQTKTHIETRQYQNIRFGEVIFKTKK